jgi:hypothetical protein
MHHCIIMAITTQKEFLSFKPRNILIIILVLIATIAQIDSIGHNLVSEIHAQILGQKDIVKVPKLQSECNDLAAELTKQLIMKNDFPSSHSGRATSAFVELQIPTLILDGIVKYNSPVRYEVIGNNNHTNHTNGGNLTNSFVTKNYRPISSLPSYTLYTAEVVKLNFQGVYGGLKPLQTKIYLEGRNIQPSVSSQLVTWQFKEDTTSKNVFVVPTVDPNHCYLLQINTDFSKPSSNGSNETIMAHYMDLIKVEEP